MDATTTTRALRYLTNEEAAMFLKLSPRTLDKFRVLGGGPKFRKFGQQSPGDQSDRLLTKLF